MGRGGWVARCEQGGREAGKEAARLINSSRFLRAPAPQSPPGYSQPQSSVQRSPRNAASIGPPARPHLATAALGTPPSRAETQVEGKAEMGFLGWGWGSIRGTWGGGPPPTSFSLPLATRLPKLTENSDPGPPVPFTDAELREGSVWPGTAQQPGVTRSGPRPQVRGQPSHPQKPWWAPHSHLSPQIPAMVTERTVQQAETRSRHTELLSF